MVKPEKQPAGYDVDEKLKKKSFAEVVENESENEEAIWNHCILEEFPIINISVVDGKAICSIGYPHSGLTMEVSSKDGVFHGTAVIQDAEELVYAMYEYSQGEVNGACKLYYSSGEIFFSGYLKNGYREGRGREFDKEGNVMFDGLFRHGYKISQAFQILERKNYWKEIGNNDKVISICSKNERGENEGICYFYSNGELERISEWHDGIERQVLYKFNGKIMTQYIDNVQRYKGEYKLKPWMKVVREGNGTWYEKDGVKVRYVGTFKRGLYHGEGNFSSGKLKLNGGWICGVPTSIVWCLYCMLYFLYYVFFYLWVFLFPSQYILFIVVSFLFYILALFSPVIIIMC